MILKTCELWQLLQSSKNQTILSEWIFINSEIIYEFSAAWFDQYSAHKTKGVKLPILGLYCQFWP